MRQHDHFTTKLNLMCFCILSTQVEREAQNKRKAEEDKKKQEQQAKKDAEAKVCHLSTM